MESLFILTILDSGPHIVTFTWHSRTTLQPQISRYEEEKEKEEEEEEDEEEEEEE